ncbi:MAG: YceI family protein [Methylococcales bacterium]|jgi:polyisoprenoid-binding protein YceI|nr:YceI family protein [Methylococcales bacterium]MBT7444459.1 YceI family protein [Methylococcales bacterium]
MIFKKTVFSLVLALGLVSANVQAAEHYQIDIKGMHAFISFKVKHLGISWLEGRFNRFKGSFDVDKANPSNNKVTVNIEVASIDSNHAERDKHLRGKRFFDVKKFPKASFVSTSWKDLGDGQSELVGNFTLRGVTKAITLAVSKVGEGKDPWGGYRSGYVGTTTLNLSDYKMKEGHILGAAADEVQMRLSIEGIRQ